MLPVSALITFQLIVFIFSAIVHEVSHGFIAHKLGDDTAKSMGRLTLNPFKHLDFFGSFVVPLLFVISGSNFIFGWAKPVPFNPQNLKNPKIGAAIIASAGPISTLILAVIFGIILRTAGLFLNFTGGFGPALVLLLNIIIYINILLAVFNLIPIPPLDGSKLLFAILPDRFYKAQRILEQYGAIFLLILLFSGILNFISPITTWLETLIAGKWAIM
ncbi:MAG: peptidase M50 [Parcubacteria group bacterium Athens0714_26]|nr:MAG: peptidase M50 [Parcubacteria group bacterium Athens1014_26]TSD01852.1 MAG: peptidase M50 [Parcubacteria group bacterium Athens0714_26]